MRQFRTVASILIGLLLLAPVFQNCAPSSVQFSGGNGKDSATIAESGNGSGYGGKPRGTFYHFIPDFRCEKKESPEAVLDIQTDVIQYTENKRYQCGAVSKQPKPEEVTNSPFHTMIVGYGPDIFERKDTPPVSIPDNLVEAWCFDDPAKANFEVIQQYDRAEKKAVGHIYYRAADNSQQEVAPFTVARSVGMASVVYHTDQYDLVIDKLQPAAVAGQYVGRLTMTLAGQSIDKKLSCRLGSYLDAQLWPAKVVADQNVQQTEILLSTSELLVRSQTTTNQVGYLTRTDLLDPALSQEILSPIHPVNAGGHTSCRD